MTKQLIDINDLLAFLDRKIFKLKDRLENFVIKNSPDYTELESEILMWKKKSFELVSLQSKICDAQILELTKESA